MGGVVRRPRHRRSSAPTTSRSRRRAAAASCRRCTRSSSATSASPCIELLDLRAPASDGVEPGLLVVAPLRISRGVGARSTRSSSPEPATTAAPDRPRPRGRDRRSSASVRRHQGELPGIGADEIAVDALALALADAGSRSRDLDGLITCKSFGGFGIDTEIGRLAGLNPRYSATLDYGTCNFSLHLAAMAIAVGMATTIALVYGTNQRTRRQPLRAPPRAAARTSLELHGFHNIAGQGAMAFSRHAHLYGTTEEQLGWVAVTAARARPAQPARRSSSSRSRSRTTCAEPYLVEPLRRVRHLHDLRRRRLPDRHLLRARARDAAERPVYLLGMEQVDGLRQYQNPDNLLRPWVARHGASRSSTRAGISRADIDVLFVQDPVERLGPADARTLRLLRAGESRSLRRRGAHRASAATSRVNTNGGQLSESYMWGWLHLCEAVRQLRGELRGPPGGRCPVRAVLLDQGIREGGDVDPRHRGAP